MKKTTMSCPNHPGHKILSEIWHRNSVNVLILQITLEGEQHQAGRLYRGCRARGGLEAFFWCRLLSDFEMASGNVM